MMYLNLLDCVGDDGVDLSSIETTAYLQCLCQGNYDVLMFSQDGLRFDPRKIQVGGDRFGGRADHTGKGSGLLEVMIGGQRGGASG
jgi:hypothetical protein